MAKMFYTLLFFGLYMFTTAQNKPVLQTGHNGSFCMTLSDDDRLLLTAGLDGRVMLWDLASTKAVQNFKPGNTAIYCAAWKKDGTRFAIGTADSLIIFYDAQTATETKRLKAPFAVMKMCFNSKHNVLAIGGNDGNIKVLDENNGSVYFSFKPDEFITGLSFSSNGALLFAAGWNNGISAYEMNQGKVMMTLPTLNQVHTTGMQLSANDEFLFIYLQNGTTEVVNLFQNKKLGSLENMAWYQDVNDTYYLEPALTADNVFVLSVNKENNLVVSNRLTDVSLTYQNSFSKAKISYLLPSHKGQFFIMADARGSISNIYFNENIFKNESPVLWRKLQASPERIYRVDFLNHDETLALTGNGYYQFNMATGDMHRRDQDSAVVSDREYSARYFMTGENRETYYYADLMRNTGYEMKNGKQRPLSHIGFSKDTSTVAFVDPDQKLVIYNMSERKKYLERELGNEILFNGSLNNFFILQKMNTISFVSTKGETVQTITTNQNVISVCADADMKQVYLLDNQQQVYAYDFKTAKEISLPGELAKIKAQMIEISPDGKTLAVFNGTTVKAYTTNNGKSFFDMDVHTNLPYTFSFNQHGNRLAMAHENGITTLWDLGTQQKICNVLVTPQDGMMVYTDEHYYMATREAARQLVFTQNNHPVSLANAELTYNRPDKVLEKIGLSTTQLLNAYRYAYERRLKRNKLNTVTNETEVPEISLLNPQELKASTTLDHIHLKLKASSPGKKLARLHVWLNNVPVYGQEGLTLESRNEMEKEIDLDLVTGTNRIKFSTVNENGTESEKQEVTVVNTQVTPPNLYLLTIGTSQYKNAAFNLNYAAKDANDLAALFTGLNKGKDKPYGHIFTKTLVNEAVTKENLKKTKDFLKQAKTNDVVMVFVAGHGVRDEDMHYFFGTHDMNFDHPGEKGFSEEDFAQLTDGLKVVRKMIFFDTCLSGEMDKEEAEQTLASNATASNGNVSFRAAGAGIRVKTAGLNNASALMRAIYNDLDEGTGSTVISSAGGAEYAMESSEWKNGLFTYCFLNGLKNLAADQNGDQQIMVNEIQDYVRKEVTRLSKGKQQPSFKNENLVMNYRIW